LPTVNVRFGKTCAPRFPERVSGSAWLPWHIGTSGQPLPDVPGPPVDAFQFPRI
jgi:hypothetical protein